MSSAEKNQHVWTSNYQPGTPDGPDEWVTACENCGLEYTDTDRDDTPCPPEREKCQMHETDDKSTIAHCKKCGAVII